MLSALAKKLIEKIEKSPEGAIPLSDYMGTCAQFYYNSKDPFGTQGDFTTAPEISQMFGELIGLLFADHWQKHGAPSHVVELGGGRGTLMSDLLRAAGVVENFALNEIYFVEQSALLKSKQQEKVSTANFVEQFSAIPQDKPLYLVANEFFDALPIEQYQRTEKGWQQRLIGFDKDTFVWRLGETQNTNLPDAPVGSIAEACPPTEALIQAIAEAIATRGGLAVIIDYGTDEEEHLGDTLQAVRRHQFHPLLEQPGEADITAHVRFGRLAALAKKYQVEVLPLQTQKAFLESLGIKQRAAMLADQGDIAQQQAIAAALKRLTAPSQMGQLFKVLVIQKAPPQK